MRKQRIAHVALGVADYDEAIAFFTEKLGGAGGATLLFARVATPEQARFVGIRPVVELSSSFGSATSGAATTRCSLGGVTLVR